MATKRDYLIKLVKDGRSSDATAESLVDAFLAEEAARVPDVLLKCTPREIQVVKFLVEGRSTREIATMLTLTISTVNTYMKRVFAKLEVHSRVELVALVNGS